MDQPGMYEPTGRCLTCDSRHCTSVCLNGDAHVDDTPEADPLAFLNA